MMKWSNINYGIFCYHLGFFLHQMIFKKGRAKPPARRDYSAYASESDIYNSSIVIRHSISSSLEKNSCQANWELCSE